jgi:fucose 4-O-acetylase-like acetyltransferase
VRNLLVLLFAAAALVLVRAAGLTAYTDMEGSYVWYAGMNLFIVLLRSLLALPFILFGWYLGRFRESEKRMPDSFAGVLTGAFLMAAGLFLAIHSDIFDLHYLYVQPLHYLTAACSCAGLLLMMYSLPVSRILSYLGRNSLVIMCTHASFFVVYYISLGMFFIRKLIPIAQPVFNLGVAVLVCAAEIPLIWFFNRHCKYLLGRKV